MDLSLAPGEIVALVGPNGAGKARSRRVLAGILPPSHGRVLVDGVDRHGPSPCIIYVPQRSTVDWTFPIDVTEVVLLAKRKARSRLLPFGDADRDAAREALRQVGMERFATVQISRLSGGQQQRVFLARALIQDGDVYLLDEPFTGVDVPTQDIVVGVLHDLAARGKTIVYATHDLYQAFRSSDRVILLNRTVIADGPPGQVATEENLRATFGGRSSIFDLIDLGKEDANP
ncbi:MAG: metal ABC transporter ATP-binding protein [Thermomicrobiales bacterium]